MRLNYEDIKNITVGAVAVTSVDGGISFSKYTDAIIAAWGERSKTLEKNARTTTGVRLDFHTDSQNLAFAAVTAGKYEIKVDGLSRAKYSLGEGDRVDFALCAPLSRSRISDTRGLSFARACGAQHRGR